MDELVGEILLRLPPDEPEHLFRAALVCKPWLRVLCDPAFRSSYRAFHRAPPLLGLLHRLMVVQGDPAPSPTTAAPLSPYPHCLRPLDCRHGRVLLHAGDGGWQTWHLVVWDPVTGEQQRLPQPGIPWLIYTAAVICAADGCDHLDCHGGPFRVVFVATHDYKNAVMASVYSSETGVWSTLVTLDDGCEVYAQHMRDALADIPYIYTPYVQPRRCTLIGDEVYFTIRRGNAIIKYNWASNCLSMINPPSHNVYRIALMVMEGSTLGFACIESSNLHLWSRKVNSEGAAEWVQLKAIKLETVIPIANSDDDPFVAGFAEGVDVIFICSDVGLFTMDLKSGQVKKVAEHGVYFSVLPYMSFYTPGMVLALPCPISWF
ncbi:F-box protein At5g03970 [Setaria viridis]